MIEDPLAALRPLHAPPPVSWWPPAPGWWLITLLVFMLAVMLYRHRRQRAPQRAALHELTQLKKDMDKAEQPIAQLNQLLKRYALASWPAAEVASLSGNAWLAFLDANGGNGQFSEGPGQLLLFGSYQNHIVKRSQLNELIELVRQWIKANPPRKIPSNA